MKFADGDGPKTSFMHTISEEGIRAVEKTEDYDVFGEEVLAPGDGVVIK